MKTKMTQEEFIKYTERMNKNIVSLLKSNEEELAFYSQLVRSFNRICDEKYKMEDKFMKNGVFSLEYDKETLKDMVLKLQERDQQLQERIEYLERSNNRREDTIFEQRQEISDLEDNWNKLKEWASNFYNSEEVGWAGCGMRYTLEKILELENETANNCNDCKQCKGSDNNG